MKVILGAGEQHWDGWQATQRQELDLCDPLSFERFFGSRLADAMLCEHVWEHLTLEEGKAAARLCFRYLRPGAILRVAVPDGHFPDNEYQKLVQVGGPGPADHPAADHQIVYTAETFAPIFTEAGFEVALLEYFDSFGRFHQVQWDDTNGPVYRTAVHDHRNAAFRAGQGKLGFTSILLDARKP